jgi:hypothetical protein
MIVSVIMAEIANHAENQPWPSLEWASWIFDRASFVLVGSLVIGASATIAIVWMGIVKEHHWDLARDGAAEQIALLQLETAKANERAAEATRQASDADLARVRLEEKLAPRRLSPEQAEIVGKFIVENLPDIIFAVTDWDNEAHIFANRISIAVVRAGGGSGGSANGTRWIMLDKPRGGSSELFIPRAFDGLPMNKWWKRSDELLGPLKELGFSLRPDPFSAAYLDATVLYVAPKDPPNIDPPKAAPK